MHNRLDRLLEARPDCGAVSGTVAELRPEYVGNTGLLRSAGCTPQERVSFTRLLAGEPAGGEGLEEERDGGARRDLFVDLFVHCHSSAATGHFSYFSQRSRASRGLNRGLRLDYFIGSEDLTDRVLGCYIGQAEPVLSDHCPIMLVLRSGQQPGGDT